MEPEKLTRCPYCDDDETQCDFSKPSKRFVSTAAFASTKAWASAQVDLICSSSGGVLLICLWL